MDFTRALSHPVLRSQLVWPDLDTGCGSARVRDRTSAPDYRPFQSPASGVTPGTPKTKAVSATPAELTFLRKKVAVDSAEAKEFYSNLFPKLHAHLKSKGWLDRYVQHVADEPVAKNADSYTTASALLKTYAPGIPVMEACLSHNMVGAIDIWVPILHELHKDFDFFQARKKAGDRLWFYTCLNPQGEYANRFVELPLIKTRLLHWINYRYELEGFLQEAGFEVVSISPVVDRSFLVVGRKPAP